jgi:hypothetical protein
MKQRQSGHAVKGPAYGCKHIWLLTQGNHKEGRATWACLCIGYQACLNRKIEGSRGHDARVQRPTPTHRLQSTTPSPGGGEDPPLQGADALAHGDQAVTAPLSATHVPAMDKDLHICLQRHTYIDAQASTDVYTAPPPTHTHTHTYTRTREYVV